MSPNKPHWIAGPAYKFILVILFAAGIIHGGLDHLLRMCNQQLLFLDIILLLIVFILCVLLLLVILCFFFRVILIALDLAFFFMCTDFLDRFLIKLLHVSRLMKLLLVLINNFFVTILVDWVPVFIVHQILWLIFFIIQFLSIFLLFSIHLLIKFILLNHLLQMLVDKFSCQKTSYQRLNPNNCMHCTLIDFNDD
jgi:hypothetical protein